MNKLSLIITIINNGFSEHLMEEVKVAGARGGTIFEAYGSVELNAQKVYGVTLNKDKEIVLIVASNKIRDNILKVIYENFSTNSEAKAVAFTLPIEEATQNLLKQYENKKKEIEENDNKEIK